MPGELGGALLGMGMSRINDDRQVSQNDRMRRHNMVYDKQWQQFLHDDQLKFWKETGPVGMMKQLEEAGLNPGLFYGMGGAGGQSTGPSTSQTHTAPTNQGELGMGIMAIQQSDLIKAQTAATNAQRDKTEAEAEQIRGAQTDQMRASTNKINQETENLMQGLDNMRQEYEVKKLEIAFKNIINYEQQASQADRLKQINTNTKSAVLQLHILENEGKISDATVQDKIKIIQQEAIAGVLENELRQIAKGQGKANIALTNEQIRKVAADIEVNWQHLDNERKRTFIAEQLKDYNTDPVNRFTENLSNALDNIFIITRPGMQRALEGKRNPIGFK